MRTMVLAAAAAVLVGTAGYGCKRAPTRDMAAIVGAQSPDTQNIFRQRCATCHGQDGTGSGPAAAAMNPRPRNWTDQAWQRSVTDAQLRTVIVGGGAAVGRSPTMPPNPDIEARPQIVTELIAIIRAVGR